MEFNLEKISKNIPRFPHKRFSIFCGTNTWEEFKKILRYYFFPQFPYNDNVVIKRYEKLFSAAAGCSYAYSFASGRMGLYVILEALGIGTGDEIVIPAFTCVVVPNAIIYRGAVPVYVDIDPKTFNIDVTKVEIAITPRTKALYAQHTFGNVCDVDRLRELAKKHGLWLIEDSAHALGTEHEGKKVGSFGDVAFFSTDHSKFISTGSGGMVTTNDSAISCKIEEIQKRSPFLQKRQIRGILRLFMFEYVLFLPYVYWIGELVFKILFKFELFFVFSDELHIDKPVKYPYPARLSAPQAMIGICQLENLKDNLRHRLNVFSCLEREIKWNKGLSFPGLRYSFLIKDRKAFKRLFSERFNLGVWFTSVCQGRWTNWEDIRYKVGSCPIAEMAAKHIVNFPTHPQIEVQIIEREIKKNLQWIEANLL